jgi:hypothetical protein
MLTQRELLCSHKVSGLRKGYRTIKVKMKRMIKHNVIPQNPFDFWAIFQWCPPSWKQYSGGYYLGVIWQSRCDAKEYGKIAVIAFLYCSSTQCRIFLFQKFNYCPLDMFLAQVCSSIFNNWTMFLCFCLSIIYNIRMKQRISTKLRTTLMLWEVIPTSF